jgi:YHS domain-containing protein
MAFVKNAKGNANKSAWIKEIGETYYFCLILADFNPNVAQQIHDNPIHVIAEAYVSRIAYNSTD